ncbi:hypothetical protein [Blastococcus sp. Marseille-P5729]|uniref:hypothetical protein n=1 Tax=Blastococcus sp. Marseille-P5729 TaxID=2086582 RepID=UPI00131E968C|nr:hypothetical protein [Blastococcus sp. Marseille-P5729]
MLPRVIDRSMSNPAADPWRVRIDRQGFVLRGISKPFTWFTSGSAVIASDG